MLRFLHSVLALLLLAVPLASTAAQPVQMARDIRTLQVTDPPFLSGPFNFVRLGGYLYFAADDGLHGYELWRTDGSAAGTTLVRDVCPGQCSGVYLGVGAEAGGLLYFRADDGTHGLEPWVSDGTPEGTRLLLDVYPSSGSYPQWFTPLGDRMVFTANELEHGRELWISDGTAAGTLLLSDVEAGPASSTPASLVTTGGLLFFNASDSDHGREPWVSDGTPGGTVLLQDVRPGAGDSTFQEADTLRGLRFGAATNGKYFFVATDGVHGQELWISDGSQAGTEMILDIVPMALDSYPQFLTALGSTVYFRAYDENRNGAELWRTDGTEAGTERLTTDQVHPSGLTVVGSTLYFAGSAAATGRELWKSDGTAAGTGLVTDVLPGPAGSVDFSFSYTGGWAIDNDHILFFADDGTDGMEPWVSDGTGAGTLLLADIAPQELPSNFGYFAPSTAPTPLSGDLFFFAWDPDLGWEPWATDGTPAGTRLVKDLNDQASSLSMPFWFPIADLTDAGHRLFFPARDDDHGTELWASRGTPGTTHLVADIETSYPTYGGSFPAGITPLGEVVLFQASLPNLTSSSSQNVWRSDGTVAGTFELAATEEIYYNSPTAAAGDVFFTNREGLRASDGTLPGTRLVDGTDGGSFPAEHAGAVYLSGRTIPTGSELFKLDASHDHAELVADLVPGTDSSGPSHLVSAAGRLLFAASTPGQGTELWASDGTEDGTQILADIQPGPAGSIQESFLRLYGVTDEPVFVASGPRAFLAADDGTHGREPWVTDGTPEGTHLALDVRPGPLGSAPRWLTDVTGTLYFSADDGAHGRELWASDGSAVGTHMVADLAPGADASSLPHFLVDADGVLYFSAFTPEHGVELWRLAGGVPELAADVLPGAESSSPSYLTVSGRRLFFFANDGVHGYEPWSLVLPSRKLRATLTGSGRAIPGHSVFLNVVLTNPTPLDQPDAQGDEFRLPIPGELTPLSVQATSGLAELVGAGGSPLVAKTAYAGAAASTVDLIWNGALAAGGSVTIIVEARAETTLPEGVLLQGEIFFDTDGDEVNDLATLTDDPLLPGDEDPSRLFAPQSALEIPTQAAPGLLLLALLLAGLAVHRLRGAG